MLFLSCISWGILRPIAFEWGNFATKGHALGKFSFGQMISRLVCESVPFPCAHFLLRTEAAAGQTAAPLPSKALCQLWPLCLQVMCRWARETLAEISGICHGTVITCKFPSQIHSDKFCYQVTQNAYLSYFINILLRPVGSCRQAVRWNGRDCRSPCGVHHLCLRERLPLSIFSCANPPKMCCSSAWGSKPQELNCVLEE